MTQVLKSRTINSILDTGRYGPSAALKTHRGYYGHRGRGAKHVLPTAVAIWRWLSGVGFVSIAEAVALCATSDGRSVAVVAACAGKA